MHHKNTKNGDELCFALLNGVKLDMLLGNANVNYDPDHHITDKNPTGFDKGLSLH